jgi:hypothetical protein
MLGRELGIPQRVSLDKRTACRCGKTRLACVPRCGIAGAAT